MGCKKDAGLILPFCEYKRGGRKAARKKRSVFLKKKGM